MRIRFYLRGDPGALAGDYRYDARLIREWRALGAEVELVALPKCPPLPGLASQLFCVDTGHIRDEGADVHVFDLMAAPAVAWLPLSIQRRLTVRPRVALVHHLVSDEPLAGWRRRFIALRELRFFAAMHGVLAVTSVTARRVRALTGRTLPAAVVPPGREDTPGVPATRRAGQRRPGAPFTILCVANVIRRKGIETLLRAASELDGNWRLEIAGRLDMEPAYARSLVHLCERRHLFGHVRFHGPLTGEPLARLYRDADVFALPSRWEGFGMVYLEAIGHGLPVIASAAGGARDLIRDGENGLLVRPGDVVALAGRLEALRDDDRLRTRLANAAARTWRAHPTWRDTAARAREFLEAVA